MNKELESFKKSLDTMIGNQVDVIGMSLTRDTANLLASLLTPPKADEVCNLIENDIHGKAIYKNSQFYIDNEKVDAYCDIVVFAIGAILKLGYVPELALLETAKEINSRVGSMVNGKFEKDLSEEAKANCYKAKYDECKIKDI